MRILGWAVGCRLRVEGFAKESLSKSACGPLYKGIFCKASRT